jgi:uncharacterized coiled-coil protein SlyX
MSTGARLTTLEQAMAELAVAQARTQANLDRLSDEMRVFKDEMHAFKDGMHASKDDMLTFRDEMRRSSRDADRRLGELSNKMGTLAEDIVAPSVPALFERLFGVADPGSVVRARLPNRKDPSRLREFDVVAWGGEVMLVNETKSRLRPEDVGAFAASLAEVRDYLSEAEGRRVVGSLSAFYVEPTLVTAAERAGLYVFGLGSGLLEVMNTPGFVPRRF